MTQKGFCVLESLIQNDFIDLIDKVVIGQDVNLADDFSLKIEQLCKKTEINYFYRTEATIIDSGFAIAISWRWLISLTHTRLIVIHDALLPKYRGFAPLPNQLIKGEKEIGITALFATQEYDKGDIITQEKAAVTYPLKIQNAIEIVSTLYSRAVCKIMYQIRIGQEITGETQDEKAATYSLWRDEDDYKINWMETAENIVRFIDAVGYPYKGATTTIDGEIIKILEAEVFPDVNIEIRQTGKVIFIENGFPVVVCGKGLLKIIKLQSKQGESLLPLKKFRTRFV